MPLNFDSESDASPTKSPRGAAASPARPAGKRATVVVATDAGAIPATCVDGLPTLVYWNICGLGQAARYALEAAGVDYADVRIDAGAADAAEYKKLWLDDAKPRVDRDCKALDFPNLPYYLEEPLGVTRSNGMGVTVDGLGALSQSNTILKHLGRAHGLLGDSPERVDLFLDEATDLDNAITGKCYRDAASLKPYFESELPAKLARWEKCLGDKTFLAGASLTVADCKAYEVFRKIHRLDAHLGTSALPGALAAYCGRFEAHPAIAVYLAGPNYLERPFNNPHAQFSGA